jgi:hypothetical protein
MKKKMEAYFLETFGVANPYSSRDIIELKKKTCLERYGVDNPSKLQSIKNKKKETFLKNFGVTNNFCRPEILKKAHDTCISLLGVQFPMQDLTINAKANGPDGIAKRFETWKKNGSIKRSRPERLMFDALCSIFGKSDVAHSVIVNGWSIDAHIKSLNTYVQLDGVFWHGLTMDDDARKSYPSIEKKWARDREQDAWFLEQKIGLVRVLDVEIFRAEKDGNIQQLLASKGLISPCYKNDETHN